jgi:hypothetical protein
MPLLYFPFTLRLHGHVLRCLRDHNFTGLDLFYRIKDCWKKRDEPHDLLLRPLERGLSFKIGEWCFATMFDVEGLSESITQPYVAELGHEELLWFLEDVVEAANLSELFDNGQILQTIASRIKEIDDLYEGSEEEYYKQLEGGGRRKLVNMFARLCRGLSGPISQMKELYAYEVADRILHDRQLCNFIAHTVMDIGFDGETVDGLRTQWVERERWPARIRSILHARDRGKCAGCRVDIIQELHEAGHIDHMFPIARGGCNDVVNLQLLCSKCNLVKLDQIAEVINSVPRYIRRPNTRRGFGKL